MAIKEGMEGASSTGSYAINPKTKLDTGIRGSVVPSTIKIMEEHSILAKFPINSLDQLFDDEAVVMRISQFMLSCSKMLIYIAKSASFAAQKLYDDENLDDGSSDDGSSDDGSSDDVATIFRMDGFNESDNKHLVCILSLHSLIS